VPFTPIVRALVGVRDAQQRSFVESAAYQLQTDGQARVRKSARNGDRRKSCKICRPRVTHNRGAHSGLFAIDLHEFSTNVRGGNRKSGRYNGVYFLERGFELAEQTLSHIEPCQKAMRQNVRACRDSFPDGLAVVRGARRKISGRLVNVINFRARNIGRGA
jgi:hypothetical protein